MNNLHQLEPDRRQSIKRDILEFRRFINRIMNIRKPSLKNQESEEILDRATTLLDRVCCEIDAGIKANLEE